jgi:hypothetical protein
MSSTSRWTAYGSVGAFTPPPAVVVDHTKLLRQLLGERLRGLAIAQKTADHDDGWAFTQAIKGDFRAVCRCHVTRHWVPPSVTDIDCELRANSSV